MLFNANMTHTAIVGVFGLPGHWELIILVLAILLLFGGKKLPELARGLGRGLRFFKEEVKGIKQDFEEDDDANHSKPEQTLPPKADSGEGSNDQPSS